jgi:hypothetical protein
MALDLADLTPHRGKDKETDCNYINQSSLTVKERITCVKHSAHSLIICTFLMNQ